MPMHPSAVSRRRAYLDAFHERGELLDSALRKGGVVAAVHADVAPVVEDEEIQVDVACCPVKAVGTCSLLLGHSSNYNKLVIMPSETCLTRPGNNADGHCNGRIVATLGTSLNDHK